MFKCNCGLTFTRVDNLHRHQIKSCRLINNRNGESSRATKRTAVVSINDMVDKKARLMPISQVHAVNAPQVVAPQARMGRCEPCNEDIPAAQMASHMRSLSHKEKSCTIHGNGIYLIQNAFKCRIASYRVNSDEKHIDYITFFDSVKSRVLELLKVVLKSHNSIKVNVEAFATYVLQSQDLSETKSFNSINRILDVSSDLEVVYAEFRDAIVSQTTDFQHKDSGMFALYPIVDR